MVPVNLKTRYMTRNDCYNAHQIIVPKGIMIHSTATPGVMAAQWFDRWNKSYRAGETDRQVCVHAFVDDKEIWQYLPWNYKGWHAGGKANDTHIGVELCEPAGFYYTGGDKMVGYDVKKNEAYFRATWSNAVDLCVYLCTQFGLTGKDIISHSEGAMMGLATGSSDVMHWFPKHGEDMDSFRAAVDKALIQQGGDDMTQERFNELMDKWQDTYDPLYKTLEDVPDYWREDVKKLVAVGAIKGDGKYSIGMRRETLKAIIVAMRYSDYLSKGGK